MQYTRVLPKLKHLVPIEGYQKTGGWGPWTHTLFLEAHMLVSRAMVVRQHLQ